jgi:hypothetical protein
MFGNFRKGRELCETVAAHISEHCAEMGTHHRFVLARAATCELKLAELARARRLAESLLSDAVERGDPVVERMACVSALVPLSVAADDPKRAEHYLERMRTEDRCGNLVFGGDAAGALAMYLDRPEAAIDAWRCRWPKIKEEGLLMQPLLGTMAVRSLGNALLARSKSRRDVREAKRLARSIRHLAFSYGIAVYQNLRACLALHEGRKDNAAALLLEAANHYDDAGVILEAAACRYREGEITGGHEGVARTALAEEVMRARGIVCPERWVATIVPGTLIT